MPRKQNIPWPEDQYYIDENAKVIWLMGSWMRAMMLADKRTTYIPGYEIKLCQYPFIQGMKMRDTLEDLEDEKAIEMFFGSDYENSIDYENA